MANLSPSYAATDCEQLDIYFCIIFVLPNNATKEIISSCLNEPHYYLSSFQFTL